ncbi:hypothetical protein ISS05_01900 [Candidatus Woesearchaeota archaeon]|nr:hypothetical protein [Candidatus Woesearchaeota archaeon]
MKKINKNCPACKSKNIKSVSYIGVKCIQCLDCGFDEQKQYEVFPEEKTSQKAKGRYTPYKSGGGKRTKKI